MTDSYNADTIEVLRGLDPVRKRPGMYTDTTGPNHLAQEVIDNSVDEALAGKASRIDLAVHADGSLEIYDNGRGMPVDLHPKEQIPGVELILTRLHAGGKFSTRNYQFAGGLHGVGVSVVNALSSKLIVDIRRGGKEYYMSFENGYKTADLEVIGSVGKQNTGTVIRFWPDARYFDTATFSVSRLEYVLRAKAVLCPGLVVTLTTADGETRQWHYEDGLTDYLTSALGEATLLPAQPFIGSFQSESETARWALVWLPEDGELLTESYVNLIPTVRGGTHVNGLRSGLTDAIREFCEFRKLIPRGVKLTPDDIWSRLSYVLSVKMDNPQFSGQTKERLSSRQCAGFVSGVVKDAFALWLNQHTDAGEAIAELALANAQTRMRSRKKIVRKKITNGPALPGKLADCTSQEPELCELFLVEGDSAGGSAKQAREREYQAILPLRGKILNTWEVDSAQVLGSQEVHDISVAIGAEPGSNNLKGLRYHKICVLADADSDGQHIATLLCALFLRHFRPLIEHGHIFIAMPPLYRIDVGKRVFYALDDAEKQACFDRIEAEKLKGKVAVTRFKGLGEMSPKQLRETTVAPDSRRLVQLTIDADRAADDVMDMLLAKRRSPDRKAWLEKNGNLAVTV